MRGRADDAGPNDPVFCPSELVEGILALLEEAGCPAEVNDEVVRLVEEWEHSVAEIAVAVADREAAAERAAMEAVQDTTPPEA